MTNTALEALPSGQIIGTASGTGTIAASMLRVGVTDASSAAAGIVGEIISASVASGSAVSLTNGQSKDFIRLPLTKGAWDIYAVAMLTGGAALTSLTNPFVFIGTATGNNTTGQNTAMNTAYPIVPSTAQTNISCIINWHVDISSDTNYYLKSFVDTINVSAFGTIWARRMR